MASEPHNRIRRACQRLLGIVIAVPVAVIAGLSTVFVLDAVLPHGKSWQIPTIFFAAFIAAGIAGVACVRAFTPRRVTTSYQDDGHPLDKT